MQLGRRMIIDPAQHIGEPALRIDAVQLGGLDPREHRGRRCGSSEPKRQRNGRTPLQRRELWPGLPRSEPTLVAVTKPAGPFCGTSDRRVVALLDDVVYPARLRSTACVGTAGVGR
jgi:hypothetical protein